MSATLIKTDLQFAGIDSSGTSITKYFFLKYQNGDNQTAALEPGILPEYGSALLENSTFYCESVGELEIFDERERIWRVQAKYKRPSGSVIVSQPDMAPWELGVQNFRINFIEKQVPLKQLWDKNAKKYKLLQNTAGSAIIDTVDDTYAVITFDKHFRFTGTHQQIARVSVFNETAETVCGIVIARYHGKLMPMSSGTHTVYENDGRTIKWKYETVHYEIHYGNWERTYLNVGKYFLKNGHPSPIVRYNTWNNNNQAFNNTPSFGSWDDVWTAQNYYKSCGGEGKIPYCEISEEMPLKADGTLYMEAITAPANNPYLTIQGYPKKGNSWSQYNIPKSL